MDLKDVKEILETPIGDWLENVHDAGASLSVTAFEDEVAVIAVIGKKETQDVLKALKDLEEEWHSDENSTNG